MDNQIRADKYLWCVRLFKTRKLSSDACSKSKVKVNDNIIKPSYIIKIGDEISIKRKLINNSFIVKDTAAKRLPAKLVDLYIEDITPDHEKIKLKASQNIPHAYREPGKGRPTKKERRVMMKGLKNYLDS